jgi:hypothetical protein
MAHSIPSQVLLDHTRPEVLDADWESPCGPTGDVRAYREISRIRYVTSTPIDPHLLQQPVHAIEPLAEQRLLVRFACGCSAIVHRSEVRLQH